MADWLSIGLVLSLGIFVQSAAGFAAGLLTVPALLWMGYTIPEASAALLVATVPQNVFGVYSLRDSIDFRSLLWPGIGRLAFFPVGVLVLMAIEQAFPIVRIRQFVGVVVLGVTLATILYNPTPRTRLSPVWAWLAFPTSGFLQGLVGMGGPAMVFWVTAHDWSARRIRGFLFAMYLISLVPALVMLYLFFGQRVVAPAVLAAISIPMLLLATWLGLTFGNWLGRRRLRRITLGLLLLMGVVGLASPWMQP
ncbi:sulfite exporter TauE/SafE family protein [Roseiconus nitratireducens]|nr:sulfite exporter TauE/SafE family protein [Roseiconus nitratireducens]